MAELELLCNNSQTKNITSKNLDEQKIVEFKKVTEAKI